MKESGLDGVQRQGHRTDVTYRMCDFCSQGLL
jgi:hypothetical protein